MIRRRSVHPDDGGFALVVAVLVTFLVAAMLLSAAAVVLSMNKTASYERRVTVSRSAAQAGVAAGISAIRAAWTVDPVRGEVGSRAALPCTPANNPISGRVGTGPTLGTYRATITYFRLDPAGKDATWRAANAMSCSQATGPAQVPLFAVVSSQGAPDAGATGYAGYRDRAIEVVYRFSVDDAALVGGALRSPSSAYPEGLCLSIPAWPPVAGARLTVETCVAASPRQSFAYRPDFTLAPTSQGQSPGGLCVTTPWSTGAQAVLARCGSTDIQQWAFNADAYFQGVATNPLRDVGLCLLPNQAGVVGAPVVLQTQCAGLWSYNLYPDAAVGAGAAGASRQQLVNYGEFGRCFDVTRWRVDYPFMISFPCKQSPVEPTHWNQRIAYDPATRQIVIGGVIGAPVPGQALPRCLTSPLTRDGTVVTRTCASGADQQWTMNRDTGRRSTSYTVVDSAGRCLAAGATGEPGFPWSAIRTQTCDGSAKQKWNAPPGVDSAGTRNLLETTGR